MSHTSNETKQLPSTERRDFLYYATASTGAVAAGAAVWPLIDSMNPSADVTASGTVRVDLSGVEPGQRITVKWQGARYSSGAGLQPRSRLHVPSISTTFPILLMRRARIRT